MADPAPPAARLPEGHCLVVGIGNDLRRDDGVGHVVARAAARGIPGVEAIVVHQVLPELAETLAGHRTVVFVDASVGSPHDGAQVEVRRLSPGRSWTGTGHVGIPAQVVTLATLIGGKAPTAWSVTVPVTDLGVGEGLSPATASLVPVAVQAVARIASELATLQGNVP